MQVRDQASHAVENGYALFTTATGFMPSLYIVCNSYLYELDRGGAFYRLEKGQLFVLIFEPAFLLEIRQVFSN